MNFEEKNKGAHLEVIVDMIGVYTKIGHVPPEIVYVDRDGTEEERKFIQPLRRGDIEKLIDILRGEEGKIVFARMGSPKSLLIQRTESGVSFIIGDHCPFLLEIEIATLAGFLEMLLENGIYRMDQSSNLFSDGPDDCPLSLRQFREDSTTKLELGIGCARIDLSSEDLDDLRKFLDLCHRNDVMHHVGVGFTQDASKIYLMRTSPTNLNYSGLRGNWKSGVRAMDDAALRVLIRIISEFTSLTKGK